MTRRFSKRLRELDCRSLLAVSLSLALVLSGCGPRVVEPPTPPLQPEVFQPLHEALLKSYEELFETAHRLEFRSNQIASMRQYLEQAGEYCVSGYEQRTRQHEEALREAQAELKRRTKELDDDERKELHCRIQNLRALKSQTEMLANHAIPVAYENREAKLDLIEQWPSELQRIRRDIESGAHHDRRFGDVKDIGFRQVGEGQEDDVKLGQETIQEMRKAGLMPPEIENEAIVSYVENLAKKIAAHSDLSVPVRVTLLNSREINAFALPGGFIFLQRGLLEAADDEAQLAGVIAHEIAHPAARHGHQLMRRATISSIIFQAAQVAALILTGGVAGIGTYYALQYGFYGLGLVLSLDLLGVSREFELEADQLGVQYAWNAGYDPSGFIRFFDKMATREGYVNAASWFRTHPPFFERMVQSQQEIMYLPEKKGLIRQSEEFKRMKKDLEKVTAEVEEEEKGRPSLLAPEEGCPPPEKIEYEPGQRIETICELPGV
jgi:beta-barrel assembly-enhancing protease